MSTTNAYSWHETALGEVIEIFDNRRVPLSTKERSHRKGTYPYYGASGIIDHIDDYIFDGKYLLISEDGANLVTRSTPIAFFATGRFWVNNHAHIVRARQNLADDYFLLSFIEQADLSGYITGTAQPKLSQANLKSIKLRLPPLDVQKRIAGILSAYDDLIENNTRRIAILEEMARAIYREWFVNFRFPGHEQVEMVESELGPVPTGWEIRPIGEVVETMGGGTPSTKNDEFWNDGDVVWFSPSDLTAAGTMFISNSRKKISELGLQKSSAKLFPPYSVMMTSRATIGVTAINTRTACTNQGFITCIPNEALSAYQIYFWISDIKEKIITLASGATFKEINKATFRELPILVPDRRTTKHFTELLSPLGRQIEILQDKNSNLRRTRDLLLPRLISGEIEVGAVEGVLAGAAA